MFKGIASTHPKEFSASIEIVKAQKLPHNIYNSQPLRFKFWDQISPNPFLVARNFL